MFGLTGWWDMDDVEKSMTKKKNTKGIAVSSSLSKRVKTSVVKNQKTPMNDWCSETNRYEPKTRLIKISNKSFYIRHGRGGLGFIIFERKGFTIANIYKMKDKKFVSTMRFNRKIGWKSAKEYIFDNAQHVVEAVKEFKKPFKATFRSTIVPLSVFKDKFKPNEFSQKSFATSTKDSALMSLNKMLKDIEPVELISGVHSVSISYADRAIKNRRLSYINSEELPAVEVFAIWSNFDPETRLVSDSKYDRGEPLYYSYDVIKEKSS